MLTRKCGLFLDFELAPAGVGDLAGGPERLEEHLSRVVIGGAVYAGAPVADALGQNSRTGVLTKPRNSPGTEISASSHRPCIPVGQFIETVS